MKMVKNSIKNLTAYKACDLPFTVKLDANEGKNILLEDTIKEGLKFDESFNLNYYPDDEASLLKNEISKYVNIPSENIIVGNGSSEMIELVIKTFVDKDEIILSPTPSFSMYSIFAEIYSTKFIGVPCNKDFSIDIDKLINRANEINPKIIILCNPNNPTGYLMTKKDITKLIENTSAIIVVDEAYIEFAQGSMINEVFNYDRLIVLRTLSKALGLAGIRLGYMGANTDIIEIINRVKSPYNLNSVSQYIGVQAFKNKSKIFDYVEEVKSQRDFLYSKLKEMEIKVYSSSGNFVFFNSNIENLYGKLADKGILIRKFKEDLEGYYRVSVGNENENRIFIENLKEIIKYEKI